MAEAKRSPIIPKMQNGTVKSAAFVRFFSNEKEKPRIYVTITLDTIPPTAPSIVLCGLIFGQSLCLPNVLPTKYAPASHTLEKLSSIKR